MSHSTRLARLERQTKRACVIAFPQLDAGDSPSGYWLDGKLFRPMDGESEMTFKDRVRDTVGARSVLFVARTDIDVL